jgi:hypothetical protein
LELYANDNDLNGCFPAAYSGLCSQLAASDFSNNPCLWQNGNFPGFCLGQACTFDIPSLTNDLNSCVGDAVILTAGNGASYTWSTGETTPSISVSPTTDSTFYVAVTDTYGCVREDSVTISMHPEYSISQTQVICDGESYSIGASTYLAGTYTDILPTWTGCDSTDNTILTANPAYALTN